MLKVCVGCLALLSLSACAGRAPDIAPLVLTSDPQLGCDTIEAETRINNAKISSLATEQGFKLGQNVVAGVAGFFIWPAWLALDFQDAATKEANALSQRNAYLLTLARDRCATKGEVASVKRPDPTPSAFASNSEMLSTLSR
jgi:hypothetical protein